MSNPNKTKPVLSADAIVQAIKGDDGGTVLSPATIEIDVPVVDEPIQIAKDEFVSISGLASAGREKLLDALRAHAEKTKAVEYVPPSPTDRQKTQTELEQEAGRKAVARAASQAAARPQPKPDPSDGYSTPAFRPGDHVPGMNSGDLGARNIK